MSCEKEHGSERAEPGGSSGAYVQVSSCSDEAVGSSDQSASSLTNDIGVGSSTSTSSSSQPKVNQKSPPDSPLAKRSNLLCNMQSYSYRYRSRRNTMSVACQTDYTTEFPAPFSTSIDTADIEDDDESAGSSDGVLRLMIQNFESMSDTVRGPSKRIHGIAWRIMVMPRQHMVQKKGQQKCLGFFLQCCPNAYTEQWSCQASAELRLISQKPGVPHFTRRTSHNYTAKENDWGYSCFMTWSDILDEAQGYIKDDRVILEVTVKAEAPKNIVTLEEFQKTIKNWIELAEMQYTRGCIDLAIEANAQAIKFCKEKDPETKTKLDLQKHFFIEQKLVESIQRIEKADKSGSKQEDEGSSQSALKLALSAQQPRLNPMKGKDKGKKGRKNVEPPSPPNSPPNADVKIKEQPKTEKAATVKNEIKNNSQTMAQKTIVTVENRNGQKIIVSEKVVNCETVEKDLKKKASESKVVELEDLVIKRDVSVVEKPKYSVEKESGPSSSSTSITSQVLSKTGKRDLNGRSLYKVQGQFNRDLFTPCPNPCQNIWARRTKAEEELYASLAKQLEESLEKMKLSAASNDKKEVVSTMNETVQKMMGRFVDMDKMSPENVERYSSALDTEIERQFIIQQANEAAKHFSKCLAEVDPYQLILNDTEDMAEQDKVHFELKDILNLEKKNERKSFVEEEAMYLDAKIRFLWQMEQAEEEQVPMSEMGIQTEPVITLTDTTKEAAPLTPVTGRILKKATSKKKHAMNALNAMTNALNSAQKPDTTEPQITLPRELLPENILLAPITISQMSTSQDMEPISSKSLEHWLRLCLLDIAAAVKNNNLSPHDEANKKLKSHFSYQAIRAVFMGDEGGLQLTTALTAVAINFVNARRAVYKIDDIVDMIAKGSTAKKMNKVINSLGTLAGVQKNSKKNEKEQKTLPVPLSGFPPELSEDELTTLYMRILDKESEGDYALIKELILLDEFKEIIGKYHFVNPEDFKMITDSVAALEVKLTTYAKQIKDFEKKLDDAEKQFKKSKTDMNNLRNQIQAEKDKNTILVKENREKNKEIKKLETKLTNVISEREEANDKAKQLQKELTSTQKKSNEEIAKQKKEIQNLTESKKHIQAELGNRDAEVKGLTSQLDDKNHLIKDWKKQLEVEKKKATVLTNEAAAYLERAKCAEISMLTQELDAGVALLERAKSDASKQARDMEDAASMRARSHSEMTNYINSRNDWNNVIEKIEGYIATAKADFAKYIELIQEGKCLSQIIKTPVAKPPPAPVIIKIPPIVSVEPTKPSPGVIGSRPQSHIPSNISPGSKSASSPVPKDIMSPTSPIRHPGAIGTRPNGIPVNSASTMERQQELASMGVPRVDQNGWDEHNNTWSSMNSANGLSSNQLTRQFWNQSAPMSSQQQQQQQQQQQMDLLQRAQMSERQRAYLASPFPRLVEKLMKRLRIDQETAFKLAHTSINDQTSVFNRMTIDEIADAICQKQCREMPRIPPGAAPGYMQSNMMGFLERTPIGVPPIGSSLLSNNDSLLSGILSSPLPDLASSLRPSTSNGERWNL